MGNEAAVSPGLLRRASTCLASAVLAGCGSAYVYREAGVPQTTKAAEQALLEMARDPKPLRRGLLVIHGWRDSARRWGNLVYWLERCMTNADHTVTVFDYSGDQSISDLTRELFERYGVSGEVDVVGHSMGGLIAREAARLGLVRIRRLFSMASPHAGSYLARYGPWFRQLREMTPGSGFLRRLNSDPRSRDFHIVTYWMEGDFLLTQDSSQSIGDAHFVLSRSRKPLFRYTHNQLVMDKRVIHDILCRLRNESYTPDCKPYCPSPAEGGAPVADGQRRP